MSWTEIPLACADTETSGPDPLSDRVVTAYLATIRGSEVDGHDWLLDPGIEIGEGATAVHGITTERAQAEGSDYEEGLLDIWASLQLTWGDGYIVAGFNFGFDLTLLTSELRRLGHEPGEIGPIFDGFTCDKHFDKFRKGSRKLVNVVAHYGLTMGDAHAADADSLAAARLAWKMPRVYPELAAMSVGQLQDNQARWYAEQARSLREYFARQGKDTSGISEDWPVRRAA